MYLVKWQNAKPSWETLHDLEDLVDSDLFYEFNSREKTSVNSTIFTNPKPHEKPKKKIIDNQINIEPTKECIYSLPSFPDLSKSCVKVYIIINGKKFLIPPRNSWLKVLCGLEIS